MKNEKVQVDKQALTRLLDYVYEAELEDYIQTCECEEVDHVEHIFNDIVKLKKNLEVYNSYRGEEIE